MADLERIRNAWPIARFFEDTFSTQFKGEGESLLGLCPFHNDTTPSLTVDTAKGLWFCHGGCSEPKGGDLFTAIEKHLGVPFQQAVEWVADHLGIPLAPPPKGATKPPLAKAVGEFHNRLRQNPEALAWLTDPQGRRGFTMDTVVRWQLGWDGEFYSIPLYSATGAVNNMKMVHPDKKHNPRQWFYVKGGKHGWFPAQTLAAHSEVVAVGGEWDVIRMQQEGHANAVCWVTGEGGLNRETAKDAKGKRVTLLLDADEAGKAATRKVAIVLGQENVGVLCVDWIQGDWGKDATEFLASRGTTQLTEMLQQAQPPSGGSARMGGYVYWESDGGYYRQREGKDEEVLLTDFILRYSAIWKAAAGDDVPSLEGVLIHKGKQIPFYWSAKTISNKDRFREAIISLCPQASFSINHLSELVGILPQFNEGVAEFESVSGPGYAGQTFVTPTVLIRAGQVLPNENQVHLVNDIPFVLAYDLAMPPANKQDAVNALEKLLSVHDYAVTVPILGHFVLAPVMRRMNYSPYTLYLTGPTGVGKTMVAKCMMNLYMDLDPLAPDAGKVLSAHSTANSLEIIGWHIQDAPVLIDDLKAGLSDMEGISRLIQHHYDAHGKSRAKQDLGIRRDFHIRGLLVLTGEQLPHMRGPHASTLRRGLILEVPTEGLRLDMVEAIHGLSPLLRGTTAAWIAWSQTHAPPIRHQPTPSSTAERFADEAMTALRWFLEFAQSWGLATSSAESYLDIAEKQFKECVQDSEREQQTMTETQVFLDALREGLASGRLTLDEVRGAGQRRIGCWHEGRTCLLPRETMHWLRDTMGIDLSANSMGRALKAQSLVSLGPKGTPTTPTHFGDTSVAMWRLTPTIKLIEQQTIPTEDDSPFSGA